MFGQESFIDIYSFYAEPTFDWSQITGGEYMDYVVSGIDITPTPTALLSDYAYPTEVSAGIVPSAGGGIFQTVLGAGTSIAAALLGKKTTTTPTTAIPMTGVAPSTTLSSLLSSPILLLGGAGLGAYLLLKKKKGRK